MKIDDLINSYFEYLLKELNYSIETKIDYESDLKVYTNFLKSHNINYININKDDIMNYLKYLDKLKYSNKTISRNLSSLRSFYSYLFELKIVKSNMFKRIRNPKVEKKLPNYLNIKEVESILESIKEETKEDIRNKCIFELIYSTGIRVSEVSNLKVGDINKSNKSIRILGKGNKERIVYYGDVFEEDLDKYLRVRDEFIKDKKIDNLFINSIGGRLSRQSIEELINKIMKKSNVNHKISPHTLRHTYATHLLDNGADLKSVQELLGHESLNTTEIYTHVSNEKLRSEYLKYHPNRNRKI